MSSSIALKQKINSIVSQVKDGIYGEALTDLIDLHNSFKHSYFIYNSPDFKPDLIEKLFIDLFPLLDYHTKMFKKTLDQYLHQWFALCISYCPEFLLQLIQKVHKHVPKPVVDSYLLEVLSNLILTLPIQSQVEQIPLLQKLLFACPPQCLSFIDERIWKLLINNLKEDDIIDLALFSVTSEDSKPAIQLSQKDPEQIISILSLNAPFSFLYTYLKGVKCKFDMVPLLAKISDTLTFEESVTNLKNVLKTFIILLDYMDESEADASHPIISNLLTRMKAKKSTEEGKEDQTVLKPYALRALIKSERLNLVQSDKIKEFFEINDITIQESILKYYVNHLDDQNENGEEARKKIYELLYVITATRDPKPLKKLIKAMIFKSETLKKIDSEKYDQIYTRIFNPLPLNEKCMLWCIRLLNFSKDSERFNRHLYEFIRGSPSCDFSELYYIELRDQIELFNASVSFENIDWFSGRSHLYLHLFKNIKAQFVLELLAYNLVSAEHLDSAIECLCHEPTVSGPLAFTSVLSLLYCIAEQMGYGPQLNFDKLHLNLNFVIGNSQNTTDSAKWLSKEDIVRLYDDVRESVPKSSFGRVLSSLVRCLTVLKSYVTITDSLAIALIMIVRCLANSAPEEAPALIAEVYNDMKEGKIEVLSDKLKKLLENQVRSFFVNDQISMYGRSSCEFLDAKIKCFGEEDALTNNIHKGLLVDACSKEVEIAVKYESKLEQPLPHMQTFLYLKGDSHNDWRNECQKSIPFNYWSFEDDKVEITSDMLSEKTNTSLLDHQHFKIYCKVKGVDQESEFNKENKKHNKLALYHSSLEKVESTSTFVFNRNELKVADGPKIHPFEPATLYGVICYLWHSKTPLPDSVDPAEIEEFSLKNAKDDIRLAIGYLSFAETHKLKVNVNEWLDKIVIKEGNDDSIFAASLLLGFGVEDGVDKEKLKSFVEMSLDTLGYYNQTDSTIIDLFEKESGMRWQFIRSVVRLFFLRTQKTKETESTNKEAEQTNNDSEQTNKETEENKEDETNNNETQKEGESEEQNKNVESEEPTTKEQEEQEESTTKETNESTTKEPTKKDQTSSANLLEVEAALQAGEGVTKNLKINNLYAMSEFATISDTQSVIATALQQLTMKESTSTFANCARAMSTLFLLNRDDMECKHQLPTNYEVNQRLLSFIDNTMYQKPLVIGSGVIDSIVSVLSKLSTDNKDGDFLLPSSFIILLLNLATTESEYSHIIDLLTKRVGKTQDFCRRILLHADEYIDADEKMAEFLNFKPPSFIRGLFRSVLKKRKANIPTEKKYLIIIKNLFSKLISKEISVFPDFCYAGMSKIGMEPWKNATNLTRLRLGYNDLQTIMGCHTEIGPQNGESTLLFKPIAQLEDKDFRDTHAWPDASSAKKDFVKIMLEAAVDETASLVFTNSVFKVVLKYTSLKEIADVVVDRTFMNSGKFSAVTLVFRKLEAQLVKSEMEDLVHECVAYHNPNKKMFDDDERIKAFYNPNDEESIAISLRYKKEDHKDDNDNEKNTQSKDE